MSPRLLGFACGACLVIGCPGSGGHGRKPEDSPARDSSADGAPLPVDPIWTWPETQGGDSEVADTEVEETGLPSLGGTAFECGSLDPQPAPAGELEGGVDELFAIYSPVYATDPWGGSMSVRAVSMADVDGDGCAEFGLVGGMFLEDGQGADLFWAAEGAIEGDWWLDDAAYVRMEYHGGTTWMDQLDAGDLDGDGWTDWVLADNGGDGTDFMGAVYALAGTATGSLGEGDLTVLAYETGEQHGFGMEYTVGDGDGDGDDDLFAVNRLGEEPRGYLFRGPIAEPRTPGEADAAVYGWAQGMSGMDGDLNGDGIADLAYNSNIYDTKRDQSSVVFFGPIEGSITTADADVFIYTGGCGYVGGWKFEDGGDVNGDGYGDLAYMDGCDQVRILAGPLEGVLSARDNLAALEYAAHLSFSISQDIDADGIADPAVLGYRGTMGKGVTTVYLYFGPVTAYAEPDATFRMEDSQSHWSEVLDGGDLDGDGFDDLLIAPGPSYAFRGGYR